MDAKATKARRMAPIDTPANLSTNATRDISGALAALLADMFALYLKTKNFHWHVSVSYTHLTLPTTSRV